MTPLTNGLDDQPWEDIIVQLEAFCRSFVKGKPWFRGGQTDTFLKGKTVRDYVFEAIESYLEEPGKYDPSKGPLIQYLKYYLLRTLVSNDLASKENHTTRNVYSRMLARDANDDTTAYYDRLVPFTEALFDDEIDYGTIMAEVEEAVKDDKTCGEIFYGLSNGLKRREIIEEFRMTAIQYDNGKKRLKTILKDIALRYDIEKPML